MKKFFQKFNIFEILIFFLVLIIFLVFFAIFIDSKSNERVKSFIHTTQKKLISKIFDNFEYNIALLNNSLENLINNNLSEIPFDTGYFVIRDNRVKEGNVSLLNDQDLKKIADFDGKFFVTNTNKEPIIGLIQKKDLETYAVYKNYSDFTQGFSLYKEKVGIFSIKDKIFFSDEFFNIGLKFDSSFFDQLRKNGILTLEFENNIISFSRILNYDYLLYVYSPVSNYMVAVAKEEKRLSKPFFVIGFMVLVILFFIKSFLSRYTEEKDKFEKLFMLEHEKFQKIVDSVSEGVVLIDENYNIIWYNKFIGNIIPRITFGKCYSTLAGKNSVCEFCGLNDVMQSKFVKSRNIENFIKNSTGFSEIVWSPILNNEGDCIAVVEVIRDVTDSVMMQQNILKSQTYLKKIVEKSPEPMITFDKMGFIKTVNDQAKTLLSPNESLSEINKIFNDEVIEEILSDKEIKNYDCFAKTSANQIIPVQLSVSRLPDEVSEDFVIIIKDMSKLKELEAQVVQSEKLSALGILAGGVAHEINNPLVGILNMAQILSKMIKNEEQKKIVEVIIDAGNETKNIVENLLSYARQNINKDEVFFLSDSMDFAIKILGSRFKTKKVSIIKNIDKSMKIKGNRGKIHQVFLNLISNAIDASNENGKIYIDTAKSDNNINIKIRDEGHGIDEKNIDRIFDPFFTTKPVGKGTGLGLSITHGIIKEHGWDIFVDSGVGEGTTFTVVIHEK